MWDGLWRRPWIGAFLLASLLAGSYFLRLEADPPVYLSPSGGAFADEGPWLHNARNLLLFGQLESDGWNPWLLSPLTHLAGLGAMWTGGVTLAVARVSALGVFFLALLALAAWPSSRRLGILIALLYGTHYLVGMYGRLVLVDNMVLLLGIGASSLLCVGLRREGLRWPWLLGAGALAGAALVTKILIIFLVPAWYAVIAGDVFGQRRGWRAFLVPVAAFSAGLFIVYGGWQVGIRWPRAEELSVYMNFYSQQQGLDLKSVAKNITMQRFFAYYSWSPVFLLLFLWSFLRRGTRILREGGWRVLVGPGRAEALKDRGWMPESDELLAFLWFLGGLALLSILRYRPLRYYLLLAPPMAWFVAQELTGLWRKAQVGLPGSPGHIRLLFLLPAMTSAALLVDGIFFSFRLSGAEGGMGISLWRHALLFLGSGLVVVAPRRVALFRARSAAAALIGATLVINMGSTLAWTLQPKTSIGDAAKDLRKTLPNDAVVTGQFAIQLTFDSRLRAVPVWAGYYNSESPFQRYGIDYLLLWDYNRKYEIRHFQEHYPAVMERAREIRRYRIKDSNVILYELTTAHHDGP